MNIQTAKEKIGNTFQGISDIAEGVYRGVRKQGEREFAAYVFDVTNKLPATEGELSNYLDRVVGGSYFDETNESDLRWNSYLYFVVSPERAADGAFNATKKAIEADRSYARKYIVSEADLDNVLFGIASVATVDADIQVGNVVDIWADKLNELGLSEVVTSERPISEIVKTVAGGMARRTNRSKHDTGMDVTRILASGYLQSLNLRDFGRNLSRRQFDGLGRVNLLFGANGVGKTSFMEGLEFLFCGENRRSRSNDGIAVEGRFNTGQTVQTYSGQNSNDFKTRQRHWYGTSGQGNENFLKNQFARFNFLNTDAAAELSLFKDIQRKGVKNNSQSLSDLLSGHEVTQIWRRIEQINNDIIDAIRHESAKRDVIRANLEVEKERLFVLRATPGEADAALLVLNKELARLSWKEHSESRNTVTSKDIEYLSDAASLLKVIEQLHWINGAVSLRTIDANFEKLRPLLEEVRSLQNDIQQCEYQLTKIHVQVAGAVNRLEEIDAINVKSVDELVAYAKMEQANDHLLAEYASAFSTLPEDSVPDFLLENYPSHHSIEFVQMTSIADTSRLQIQVVALEHREKVLSNARSHSELQIKKLADAALALLAHNHKSGICPLCQTAFEADELRARIQKIMLSPADDEFSEVSSELLELNYELGQSQIASTYIESLVAFCNARNFDVRTCTVDEAMYEVARLRELRASLLASNQSTKKRIEAFAEAGLTVDRILDLCVPIDGQVNDESQRMNVRLARERAATWEMQLKADASDIESHARTLNARLDETLQRAGYMDSAAQPNIVSTLQERVTFLVLAKASLEDIFPYISIEQDSDLRLLHAAVDAVVSSAQAVLNLIEKDERYQREWRSLEQQIAFKEEELVGVESAIKRLQSAEKGLRDVIQHHSLEKATSQVVQATHKVAAAVFNRIHSPGEYTITDDAKNPLTRKSDGMAVSLDEISTGQRAAYALSMFLAMNAMVNSGPKVVMLDDPISQIDDLNALSFLDYLRNLVLYSERQLFFATADEKVAGLFMHKFGFLGSDFKLIQLGR